MNYSKIRKVKSPTKGTVGSAGIDFYVPEFDEQFISDFLAKNKYYCNNLASFKYHLKDNMILVKPQNRILVPSGIKVKVPEGYALIAFNKSGVATKKGFDLLASVVDSDYQGEVHISIVNTGSEVQYIEANEKLIQFILVSVGMEYPIEVTFDELYPIQTARGESGFGSTDKK